MTTEDLYEDMAELGFLYYFLMRTLADYEKGSNSPALGSFAEGAGVNGTQGNFSRLLFFSFLLFFHPALQSFSPIL